MDNHSLQREGSMAEYITAPKPPLGARPRRIHEEMRVDELLGAIRRYAEADFGRDLSYIRAPLLRAWAEELCDIVSRHAAEAK
jgi:hypothetical protein